MKSSSIKKQNGFTLVEVLISLAIFAVLTSIMYLAFNIIRDSNRANEIRSERLRDVQFAIRQIEDDINNLVFRERRNEYGDRVALLKSESGASNSFIEFTRANWRNPAKLARSNLQHLMYQFDDESLVRHHWLYVDSAQEGQQFKRTLLTNVENLTFEFLKEDDWKKEWEVEEDNLLDLPEAIKVTVELKDLGKIYRIFPMATFGKVQANGDTNTNELPPAGGEG